MRNKITNFFLMFIFLLPLKSLAQDTSVTMADQLKSEGKIFVVIAVILIILAGIFFYLFKLERKIKTIERELKCFEEKK